eukprot:12883383-Prorocentrum_lima.AAC.1
MACLWQVRSATLQGRPWVSPEGLEARGPLTTLLLIRRGAQVVLRAAGSDRMQRCGHGVALASTAPRRTPCACASPRA